MIEIGIKYSFYKLRPDIQAIDLLNENLRYRNLLATIIKIKKFKFFQIKIFLLFNHFVK